MANTIRIDGHGRDGATDARALAKALEERRCSIQGTTKVRVDFGSDAYIEYDVTRVGERWSVWDNRRRSPRKAGTNLSVGEAVHYARTMATRPEGWDVPQ